MGRARRACLTDGRLSACLQVPADTFFDEEDRDAREMTLRLLTGDRQEVSNASWLQFEPKNQEFIGLPMDEHVGRSFYHLVSRAISQSVISQVSQSVIIW